MEPETEDSYWSKIANFFSSPFSWWTELKTDDNNFEEKDSKI